MRAGAAMLCVIGALAWSASVSAQELLTLEAARARARASHETWEITRLRVVQAQKEVDLAWAQFFPRVEALASLTRNPEEVTLGGRVVQPLYVWNVAGQGTIRLFDAALWARIDQAKTQLEGSRAQAMWEQRLLELEVTRAWFTLWALRRQQETFEQIVALRREDLARTQALVATQQAVRLDLERAKVDVLDLEQQLIEAVAAAANASDALALLLGEPLETTFVLAGPPALSEGLGGAQGLEGRADVVARTREIEVGRLEETARFRAYFPALDLSGGASLGPPSLTRPDGSFWSVTLSLNWVLYDGGTRSLLLDQQEARTQELEVEQRLFLRQEEANLRRIWRDFEAARKAQQVLEARQENAKEAMRLTKLQYEAGLISSLEIRDANQELLDAKLVLISNVLTQYLSQAQWQALSGS